MWRVKEKGSSGAAMFLMGRWQHHQLKPGVQGGKLVVGRERDGGWGEAEKEGVVVVK